jgi:hypothetical protein
MSNIYVRIRIILFSAFLLLASFAVKANMSCIWTSHKAGITIHYTAPCDMKNQVFLDSVLTVIVGQLQGRDTSLSILVFIDHESVCFPDREFANFFSIGMDTLRRLDDNFIFDYYWNQQSISAGQNGGRNLFDSRKEPLDINATNKKRTNQVGLKIIYNLDYRLGKPVWQDIVRAVVYAAYNPENIKAFQKRDTVRYNTNGWYVSLVTVDTTFINNILNKAPLVQKVADKQKAAKQTASWDPNGRYALILGIFIVAVVVVARRRAQRKKSL